MYWLKYVGTDQCPLFRVERCPLLGGSKCIIFYGKINREQVSRPSYRGCPLFGGSIIRGFTVLHNSPKKDHPLDVSTCSQGRLGSPLKQVYSEHQEDWQHSPMTVVVGRPERSVLGQLLHRTVHSHWVLPGCFLVGTQRKEGPYWVKARERERERTWIITIRFSGRKISHK